jgi:hypothetical protein
MLHEDVVVNEIPNMDCAMASAPRWTGVAEKLKGDPDCETSNVPFTKSVTHRERRPDGQALPLPTLVPASAPHQFVVQLPAADDEQMHCNTTN